MVRDWRIDTMRLCAVLGVIGTHVFAHMSHLVGNCRYPNNISLFAQIANFAVPSFFVISGYLICERLSQFEKQYRFKYILRKIWRVYRLYLIWGFIYLVYQINPRAIYYSLLKLSPLTVLFGSSTRAHLWFLPVLCVGYLSVYFSYNIRSMYIVAMIFIIYSFAMITGPYNSVFGRLIPSVNNNYLVGISFCLIGAVINKNKFVSESIPLWVPIALLVSGSILVLLESRYQYSLNPTSRPDFMVGTIAYSGWFLTLPRTSALFGNYILPNKFIIRFAKYAFGVYLIHPLVMEVLYPVTSRYTVLLAAYPYIVYHCLVCVVFLASLVSVYMLSRLRLKFIIS